MPNASSDGLEIRSASEADRSAIREVTLAAYDEYRAPLGAEGWAAYSGNIKDTVDTVDIAHCIVAVREGSIVGSVVLFPPQTAGYGSRVSAPAADPEVRLLAVPPAERGHGVGQALMDECKRRATAGGASHLGLHTSEFMQAALRMYERMGFERNPETDFRPRPDFVVMGFRLRLSPTATPRA